MPAVVIGIVAFGPAQALASSAPTVVTYEKTCVALTERITSPSGAWFEAEMSGVVSPAGFIVLNGTVTASSDGSFMGAQVHQRSNLDGGDGITTT